MYGRDAMLRPVIPTWCALGAQPLTEREISAGATAGPIPLDPFERPPAVGVH
jgi:hypothetical protein